MRRRPVWGEVTKVTKLWTGRVARQGRGDEASHDFACGPAGPTFQKEQRCADASCGPTTGEVAELPLSFCGTASPQPQLHELPLGRLAGEGAL